MDSLKLNFSHLNIRQSIAILLAKLVTADIVLATIVLVFYALLLSGENFLNLSFHSSDAFLIIFGVIGFLKIILTIYVVLQWLNEYYEITAEYIYHKRGIIFRKTEQYRIEQIRRVEIEDSFLGELFNYATIVFYDLRLNKTLEFYLIHNPRKYAKVLKDIRPEIEIVSDHVNLPFLPKEETDLELED